MLQSLPPLRLLLYLEWILLGLSTLSLILTSLFVELQQSALFAILRIIAFGVMGLRLPTGRLDRKIIYTAVEFGIILLPAIFDNSIRIDPFTGMIAVLRGCQMFRLPGRLTVTGLVFLLFLYPLFSRNDSIFLIRRQAGLAKPIVEELSGNVLLLKLNNAFALGLTLMFVLLLVNALLAERRSRQDLASAHEQLRQYALRIENQATLQERNRIAREIHDSLGHALTAQTIQLENALLFLPSNIDKAREFLREAKQLGYQALQEVSRSVATLRADMLRGQTLETAISALIRDFRSTTNLTPDYTICLASPVTPEVSTAIYRILQEALTNISKHSAAKSVIIELQSNNGRLHLLVEDNGRGFNPEQNTTGFGLQGMRERAAALGGNLHVISEPGKGCRIQAIVPILDATTIQKPKSESKIL